MKFSVGEIALIARSDNHPLAVGLECEIRELNGISAEGNKCDYIVYIPGYDSPAFDKSWAVNEHMLAKLGDPDEVSDWDSVEIESGWNPTREESCKK